MSCKILKSGVVNSKVLMTKWDVNSIDRLTRADFYNDHFQPRDPFLIPHGVSYPNERTMLKAMNEIQRGLKNGDGKEWRIVQWRRGARVVRLYDPREAALKERNPPSFSGDVTRENGASGQLQRKESITSQRVYKPEAKRSEASPTLKKAPRSIFTVNERRNDVQGQNHQEAVFRSFPPRDVGLKGMEKRDLEMAIHGLEDFEQYTHDQLQKILEVNKRFFQLNQRGHQSKLSTKQIKNVLNSQEAPKRNKMLSSLESQRTERILNEETMEEDVCNEIGMMENVRSEMNGRKNCVKEKDDKKQEVSDVWSDEKYVFAGYRENSESSLFDSDSNNCENKFPENDQDPITMVMSVQSDKLTQSYIPPIYRLRHTLMKTGLGEGRQINLPGPKRGKRFPTGGVIMNENEGGCGEGVSYGTNDQIDRSGLKFIKRFTAGDVTVNPIEEGGGEMVGFDVKSNPTSRKGASRETKGVPVNGSRYNFHTPQGRICYDTRSINEYSRGSCKPLRKESPATSTIGSSHAVNQRKKNVEIDRENNRLSAKLEHIKTTPPKNSITFRTSRQEQLPFARIQRRVSKKSISD